MLNAARQAGDAIGVAVLGTLIAGNAFVSGLDAATGGVGGLVPARCARDRDLGASSWNFR
jgi:hypothetical protein